ncbi:MAG: hypothetical protein HZC11_09045 [Nitrospirae bacterium]|nr:hypothetical protein [Nitrospirota bacterium]
MRIRKYLRGAAVSLLIGSLLFGTISCGTILYPERRGQPAGRIDVGVAVLDGIGLLFFLVPGVIAFAVDFATGAIYLPSGKGSSQTHTDELEQAAAFNVNGTQITQQVIESLIEKKTGHKVNLGAQDVRVTRVDPHGSGFWSPINEVLTPAQLAVFANKK